MPPTQLTDISPFLRAIAFSALLCFMAIAIEAVPNERLNLDENREAAVYAYGQSTRPSWVGPVICN
jgi:hypothetical protein